MIKRYRNEKIAEIWSDENKLNLWQKTELMVLKAKASLKIIEETIYEKISKILLENKINLAWWRNRDKEIHHDLNAFVEERIQHLPKDLQAPLHEKITSYDTEESAFVRMLKQSVAIIEKESGDLLGVLKGMALKFRFTIMCSNTHGQWAELQTFGKKCLCWYRDLKECIENIEVACRLLKYSKISGASGNYGSIDPKVEKEALKLLGFEPYYGATQILPRLLFGHLAESLCQLVLVLNKIALDIRLGSVSGCKIVEEPRKKAQKGSSAMPHKKNPINTEQMEGMARMALGYMNMIMQNIPTWDERAIEQSCVERVAWPDLFHVVTQSLKVMNKVLGGLMVYPDNMLREVVESRGCYASSEAKEFIRKMGIPFGLSEDEGWKIIQLAAFNVFEPDENILRIRQNIPDSFAEALRMLAVSKLQDRTNIISIQDFIPQANLRISSELDCTQEDVEKWNTVLSKLFSEMDNMTEWTQLFSVSYLLRNESILFQEILGE